MANKRPLLVLELVIGQAHLPSYRLPSLTNQKAVFSKIKRQTKKLKY